MNFWERWKHRRKLSVAIPINGAAYEVLKDLWKIGDLDMGDTILRLYEENQRLKACLEYGEE